MARHVPLGDKIIEEDFRKTVLPSLAGTDENGLPKAVSDKFVHKAMAKQAYNTMSNTQVEAYEISDGMKEAWGTGISTRVLIYNALGIPLTYRWKWDFNGRWSEYEVARRLEVGQWSIGFHHKTGSSMRGSAGVVSFNLQGYGYKDVLVVGFGSAYRGDNSAYCEIVDEETYKYRMKEDNDNNYKDLVWGSGTSGRREYGRTLLIYDTANTSSPTMSVIVTRSDIGL